MKAEHLRSLIREYNKERAPRLDNRLAEYRGILSLAEVIERAGISANGKRLPHQYRIKKTVMAEVRDRILEQEEALARSRSFEAVRAIVQACSVKGFGELTVYDTALAIAAHMGLYPERVYLHRGTKDGARALGLPYKAGSLSLAELPEPLRNLDPLHVENFLCIYKNDFQDVPRSKQASGSDCSPPDTQEGGGPAPRIC